MDACREWAVYRQGLWNKRFFQYGPWGKWSQTQSQEEEGAHFMAELFEHNNILNTVFNLSANHGAEAEVGQQPSRSI